MPQSDSRSFRASVRAAALLTLLGFALFYALGFDGEPLVLARAFTWA